MGCDIHLFCERRVNYDEWECVDRFRYNDEKAEPMIKDINDIPRYFSPTPLYNDRSYAFFTMLAGVRNSGGVEQIDDRRGLPHDTSKLVKAYADYWGTDGHSFSWYSAEELFRHKYKLEELEVKSEETEWAYYALCKLCKALITRIAEEYYFDADSDYLLEEKARRYADKFRVVFWFDC